MSENCQITHSENAGFRADQVPNLPEPDSNRKRLGEDLQPVGDYAGIEPYYRVREDAETVQHHEQSDPSTFESEEWWWNHQQIRFLNGKAFVGLSFLWC